MGFAVEKRPIRTAGLLASTGTSTVGPTDVASGVAVESDIKLSTQSLTGTDAAQTLSHDGVSFLTVATSNLSNDFLLPAPQYPGQAKYVFVTNDTTSVELNIQAGPTTGLNFWGTTFNTATISAASTGSPGGTAAGTVMLGLVAHSTTQWAVFPGSTFNWDFAGSTGSTSQG